MKPRLVGIGGTLGAGKDTASLILTERLGFTHISTSDSVRAEARQRFGSVDRDILRTVANNLRTVHGAGALCVRAIAEYDATKAAESEGLVISGLRAVGEAEIVRSRGGLLLFLDAPIEVRFDRLRARNRLGEVTATLEDFRSFEESELAAASDTGQNITGVRDLSHVVIYNDRGEEQLTERVLEVVTSDMESY